MAGQLFCEDCHETLSPTHEERALQWLGWTQEEFDRPNAHEGRSLAAQFHAVETTIIENIKRRIRSRVVGITDPGGHFLIDIEHAIKACDSLRSGAKK